MASTLNIEAYSDALVILGTSAVIIPIVRRSGLSPVIGYLAAGALLGPLGLGSFIGAVPVLYWFTVVDARNVAGIAELGIVFLLFLIGLELSFSRLLAMRRLVFGLGLLQVLVTTSVIAGVAALLGRPPAEAVVLGAALSLSSTAIVIELLSEQGRLSTGVGRATFSVLLAQDLAVIPILIFISIGAGAGSVMASVALALAQAGVALVAIVILGRLLLRPLFRLVATTHSSELFIAAVLFVIVASGLVANQAGLSMALGAFVAGLLLAETEYGKAIQSTVDPIKGLLLGMFFFTVGMSIDTRELLREPARLAAFVAGLIALKSLILIPLARVFRLSWPAAIESGLLLGSGGEFAFVCVGAATAMGLMEARPAAFVLAAAAVTMALTPLLSVAARRIGAMLSQERSVDPELKVRPAAGRPAVLVIGYGRVGKVVCSLLARHGVPFIAVDYDAASVTRDRREGHEVYYGDAADPAFLRTCGLMKATGTIVTIQSRPIIDQIVETVRALRPDILIVSRARDAEHARHLYARGVTDAVPETIEASLQIAEASLVALGIAAGPAIASIHDKREELRLELRDAAAAGRIGTRAGAGRR